MPEQGGCGTLCSVRVQELKTWWITPEGIMTLTRKISTALGIKGTVKGVTVAIRASTCLGIRS